MQKIFGQLTRSVEIIGAWVGFVVLVGGAFSWLASVIPWLADRHWSEYVFIGYGLALITSLFLSAALVAWRYFNPLPEIEKKNSDATLANKEYFDLHMRELNASKIWIDTQFTGIADHFYSLDLKVEEIQKRLEAIESAKSFDLTPAVTKLIAEQEKTQISFRALYAREKAKGFEAEIEKEGIVLASFEQENGDFPEYGKWESRYGNWRALVKRWQEIVSPYSRFSDVFHVPFDSVKSRKVREAAFKTPDSMLEFKLFMNQWINYKHVQPGAWDAMTKTMLGD